MKRNAIVRIILFSITIVVLLGILLACLGIGKYASTHNSFSVPGSTSFSSSVKNGKVGSGAVSSSDIRELQLEWVGGTVKVLPGDGDKITFTENTGLDEADQLRWEVRDGRLIIAFCENKKISFGFTLDDLKKDLTVTVPKDLILDKLTVDSVSADVEVTGQTGDRFQLNNVSGKCSAEDCVFDKVVLETVSGDLDFRGTAVTLEIHGVSADCSAELDEKITTVDFEGVSGGLKLTLPQGLSYTTDVDTVSGSVHGDRSSFGSFGHCEIEFESVSGNLTIQTK